VIGDCWLYTARTRRLAALRYGLARTFYTVFILLSGCHADGYAFICRLELFVSSLITSPLREKQSIVMGAMSVCLSVLLLRMHIAKTMAKLHHIFVRVACVRGSVILWWR